MIANRPPVADFSFSPTAPQKGETVNFSSLASDPENRIQSLTWDLDGDNQFDDASGPTARRRSTRPGNHTVRLKITGPATAARNTATKTITVPSQPPAASFDFSPDTPLSLQRVTFTSTSTDPDGSIVDVAVGHRQRRRVRRRHRHRGVARLRHRRHQDRPAAGHRRRRQRGHDDPHRARREPRADGRDRRSHAPRRRTTQRHVQVDLHRPRRLDREDGVGHRQRRAIDDGTGTQITKSFPTTGPQDDPAAGDRQPRRRRTRTPT